MLGLAVLDKIRARVGKTVLPANYYFVCSYGMDADHTRGRVSFDCWYTAVGGVSGQVFRSAAGASNLVERALNKKALRIGKTERLSAMRSLC